MKWKVCGMRDPENIAEALALKPDFMGFIFYPKSKRYVEQLDEKVLKVIQSTTTKTVGVFVNASMSDIMHKQRQFLFDYVQLHGDEEVSMGIQLKKAGLKIIKVFRIDGSLPIDEMEKWSPVADYFLFDTATKAYGGSGQKFDWEVLKDYKLSVPFLLSGGISNDDMEMILGMNVPELAGVDVNSRMEITPGLKDLKKLEALKESIC